MKRWLTISARQWQIGVQAELLSAPFANVAVAASVTKCMLALVVSRQQYTGQVKTGFENVDQKLHLMLALIGFTQLLRSFRNILTLAL